MRKYKYIPGFPEWKLDFFSALESGLCFLQKLHSRFHCAGKIHFNKVSQCENY